MGKINTFDDMDGDDLYVLMAKYNISNPTPDAATALDDESIRRDDIAEAGQQAAESLSESYTNRLRRRSKS